MNYRFDEKQHIHFLEESPLHGTSTIIKDVMPPFLAKWGGECAVRLIRKEGERLTGEGFIPTVELLETEGILDKAINAWSKERKEKAEQGTDLHLVLQGYVKHCIDEHNGLVCTENHHEEHPKLSAFIKWADREVAKFIFAEKNTYSKELWVGGQVDCLALMKNGKLAVIDHKSSKVAYFNQFVQTGGYAYQLDESGYGNADGSDWKKLEQPIELLIIIPFGGETLRPEIIENVQGFKEVFKYCVGIYKFLKDFKQR